MFEIHVSWVRYKKFKKIADMTEFVTTDPKETQLHACKWMVNFLLINSSAVVFLLDQ